MIALLTARGYLTAYAFACGYAELQRSGMLIYKEHGVYHVVGSTMPCRAFRTIREARRYARGGKV